MTWTHLVWLCREALRGMYERLENGAAAADNLRAKTSGIQIFTDDLGLSL